MLIKVFWKSGSVSREIYAIRKNPTYISGFSYPILLDGHDYPPHRTYHSDKNRKPKIHHHSRSGKVLDFMTLEEPYLQEFQDFNGIVWSAPGFAAAFNMYYATNVSGHPDEAERTVTFHVHENEVEWTHYLHILLVERTNFASFAEDVLDRIANGYHVINHEVIDDGNEPNILVVFSKNRVDQME